MKKLITLICAALCLGTLHAGENVTLLANTVGGAPGYSTAISLAAGDLAELLYCTEPGDAGSGTPTIEVVAAGTTFDLKTTTQQAGFVKPIKVAGPATLRLRIQAGSSGESKALATVAVKRAGSPSEPVQIPLEAGSNFNVIFENSSDLVNWFPVPAGVYASTETRRFFRIRMVRQ